jgi:hypothetical protein
MRPCWLLALVVAAAGHVGRVGAAEPGGRWWPWNWCAYRQPCPCCPDDYCPKTLPAVAPVKRFGKDDYCPKTLPCTAPVKRFGTDDYCPKPLPIVTDCYPPWYTCGAAGPPCAPCGSASGR